MAGDSKLPGAHFIIGGDGTHRGAYEMAELMKEKNWNCSAPWLQGDTLQLGNVNQHEPTDPMKVGVDQYVFDSCVAVCV
jgi:esterase/lipase